jgi:repressor of nif and glnA expression
MARIASERKVMEILRILKDHHEPMGAKRLSELLAEHGYILTDRAVQYYLRYLDEQGFTRKVGNTGRVLTPIGISEIERALVDERLGFIISRLERLAYRSTFDPASGTGDVAYNLSIVPESAAEAVADSFEAVINAGYGFFSGYTRMDQDPRIPSGHTGFITICSITMDGVLQRLGIPVRVVFGGRLEIAEGAAIRFIDLIRYRGTTINPLQLFISAGLTSVKQLVTTKSGVGLANIRTVPIPAERAVRDTIPLMRDCGFLFPLAMGTELLNLPPDPYRLAIASYSGMNLIAHGVERGCSIKTEIGAGTIPFSRIQGST